MTSFFDEAVKYRDIARQLHSALGRTPCTCVETAEYQAFQQRRFREREQMTYSERLLDFIQGEQFEGQELEVECARCLAMFRYEQEVGDEAMDLEVIARLQQRENNGNG